MPITRRHLLAVVATSTLARPALAAGTGADSPFGERSIGLASAPVTAVEFFSLTCTHCAHFATVTMPEVKPKLVDTGKLRIVYKDFPLDQVALMAAQVARYLPAAEYYPFIEALFASQNDWAFAPGIDYHQTIFKYAVLAGMDQATFNAALADDKLKNFILQGRQEAESLYHVDATPSFLINGQLQEGAFEYDDFAALVAKAAAGAPAGPKAG